MLNPDILEEAWNDAHDYKCELEILLDKVGKLDDVIETDYIDDRMKIGAYQHIKKARTLILYYMDEIQFQLVGKDNE